MKENKTNNFLLIGGGWRAEFYMRIARKLPDHLNVTGIYCSDQVLREKYNGLGYRCFDNLDSALSNTTPDFIVICVNRFATAKVITDVVKNGIPILTETPITTSLDEINSLLQLKNNNLIQVAEQYHLRPDQQARYNLIASGIIGEPEQASISLTNNYHAISLMRSYLNTSGSYGSISAKKFSLQGYPGFERDGVPEKLTLKSYDEIIALFDFNNKIGIYNFESDQHRSFMRTQTIQIKGTKGVIDNDLVKYLTDDNEPIISNLTRINIGQNENMEGIDSLKGILFEGKWIYKNPFINIPFSDDEIALATLLLKMAQFCDGGPIVYSLEQAAQDLYLTILIENSIKENKDCRIERQSWTDNLGEQK